MKSKPRAALVRCPDYEEARVEAAVHDALALLGGIGGFVKPGERVFLKVNLLVPRKIEEAVTTHPAVVKAVVKQVQAAGAVPIIGDSPGGPFTASYLARAYRAAGLDRVAEETGAVLNYDVGHVDVPHPEGRILKRITLAKAVAESQAVITLPKLKTHGLTYFTGAVKNLFGVIPGLLKMEYHLKMPDAKDFSDMLIDILTLVKPRFALMDGIVGMEGEGPSAGNPRSVGLIVASPDSLACDVAAASVIGIAPEDVTTIEAATRRGMTSGSLSDIDLRGEPLDEVRLRDFKPNVKGFPMERVPRPFRRLINRSLRPKPVVRAPLCTSCGTCVKVCPPKAITLSGKTPETDYRTCIRCFCCQELCPESAIGIWRPLLSRLLLG